ncbi:24192_t:CDS:2 [Entrophospora sp. SA101]|nr:24192_t:CDS:2 [Entrophospora sp. SA101]
MLAKKISIIASDDEGGKDEEKQPYGNTEVFCAFDVIFNHI